MLVHKNDLTLLETKRINLISLIVNWFLEEIVRCLIITSGIGAMS